MDWAPPVGALTVRRACAAQVKYVEGSFNEDYIQTLGVNFMEKSISIRNTEITFRLVTHARHDARATKALPPCILQCGGDALFKVGLPRAAMLPKHCSACGVIWLLRR